jgi:hypothetical protein
MGFTNKVSNLIKQQISNNLVSGLTNTIKGSLGQPKKIAAVLANKSPLDLSQSPVAHMEAVNNPFQYGNVYYPEETSNLGDGHYIIFDIIENNRSEYGKAVGDFDTGKVYPKSLGTVGEGKLASNNQRRIDKLVGQGFSSDGTSVIRKQNTGLASTYETHSRLASSIVLYSPPQNKFDYKVGYENVDAGLAGLLAGIIDGKDRIGALKDSGISFVETIARSAIEIVLPGFGGVIDKTRGRAVNPKTELVFKNVPFRTFNFPFEFSPKSEKEKEDMYKIINQFKFFMMPEIKSEGYLTSPSEFQITYMYRDKANMYIPKISRCVLTDMSLDFAPEGVFTTFKGDEQGAAPVLTKMDLSFTELEIMTKETIATGH